MKYRPQPSRVVRHTNAFTLVEIAIAMAVAAFCIIVLAGLLPVGLRTATESRRETRSFYLAQQIVSDLRASPFTSATILSSSSSGTLTTIALSPPSLASASTNCVSCDAEGNVLAAIAPTQYALPLKSSSANYLVQIAVQPSPLANLSTVSVEVSAPAPAALSARSRYSFQTMIGNRQ